MELRDTFKETGASPLGGGQHCKSSHTHAPGCDCHFPAGTDSLLCELSSPTPCPWWCLCLISCQQSRRWETFTSAGSIAPCSLAVSGYLQPPMLFLTTSSMVSDKPFDKPFHLRPGWITGEASHQTSSREMVTFFLQWQESSQWLGSQLNTSQLFALGGCYESRPATICAENSQYFLKGKQKKRCFCCLLFATTAVEPHVYFVNKFWQDGICYHFVLLSENWSLILATTTPC